MEFAPIILFVYDRPEHTRKTIEALKKNRWASNSELFIFSDASKNEKSLANVKKVREYIKTVSGFKNISIKESEKNKGLANSIIHGVTGIIDKYGKVIVLEDDLITSINFLEYMNEALDFYGKDTKIWSISAYNLPIKIPENYNKEIYLSLRACSWGWATWKDRWGENDWDVGDYSRFILDRKQRKLFNRGGNDMVEMLKDQMEGRIDSWAIRWCYSQFKYGGYCIYPVTSKVQNIGLDGTGVHCGKSKFGWVELDSGTNKTLFCDNLEEDQHILKNFRNYYRSKTLKRKIGRILKKLGLYEVVKRVVK